MSLGRQQRTHALRAEVERAESQYHRALQTADYMAREPTVNTGTSMRRM